MQNSRLLSPSSRDSSPPNTTTASRRKRRSAFTVSGEKTPLDNACSKTSFGKLLELLNSLSLSNARCSFALQALLDGSKEISDVSNSNSNPNNEEKTVHKFHDHADANLLLTSTFIINGLIKILKKYVSSNKTNDKEQNDKIVQISAVLSSLCYLLGKSILSDRPRLERCSNSGSNTNSSNASISCSRKTIGRAIVSTTIGSTLVIQALTNTPFTKKETMDIENCIKNDDTFKVNEYLFSETSLRRDGLWCSILALEMMVHLSQKPSISSMQFWGSVMGSSPHQYLEKSQIFTKACEVVDGQMNVTMRDQIKYVAFSFSKKQAKSNENDDDTNESLLSSSLTLNKRQRRQKLTRDLSVSDTPMSLALDEDTNQIPPESYINFDGRISVRRWGSTSFVWLCKGQQAALQAAAKILSSDCWTKIFQFTSSPIPEGKTRQGEKPQPPQRRTRQSTQQQTSVIQTPKTNKNTSTRWLPLPGNVARIIVASRLIDLVDETGTSCGVRAPTGGIDSYAGIVLGIARLSPDSKLKSANPSNIVSSTKKKSIRSTRSRRSVGTSTVASEKSLIDKIEWYRPDIRHLAALVIRNLILAHSQCLSQNFADSQILLNQGGSLRDDSFVNSPIKFYPEIARVLIALTRSAASSIVSSAHVDASDGIARLSSISCAMILSQVEEGRNLDLKLISFMVSKLETTISGIFSSDQQSGNNNTRNAESMDVDKEGNDGNVNLLHLLERTNAAHPISLQFQKLEECSEKFMNSSSSCTFGDTFPPSSQENLEESSTRLQNEEIFVLYLRSGHSLNEKIDLRKETAFKLVTNLASKLFSKLFYILKLCYMTNKKSQMFQSTRLALATDILNILTKCLQKRSFSHISKDGIPLLMNSVKKSLTIVHIKNLIHLQPLFEKTIFSPYVTAVSNENSKSSKSEEESIASLCLKRQEFNLPERQLW